MTIHKSKGLEFPIVFVAGVNQGMLPHEKNVNVDEEKRLDDIPCGRFDHCSFHIVL